MFSGGDGQAATPAHAGPGSLELLDDEVVVDAVEEHASESSVPPACRTHKTASGWARWVDCQNGGENGR